MSPTGKKTQNTFNLKSIKDEKYKLEKSQEIYLDKYKDQLNCLHFCQKICLQEGHRYWMLSKVVSKDPNLKSYIIEIPDGKIC